MKSSILKLILVGALTIAGESMASSFAAPPVGSFPLRVNAKGETAIGLPLERAAVFAGRIDKVVGDQLTLAAAPAWSTDRWAGAEGELYYCQVVTGELAGATFEIGSNGSNSLKLLNKGEDLGLLKTQARDGTGDTVRIIPYWTPETVFSRSDVPDGTTLALYELDIKGFYQMAALELTYREGQGWRGGQGEDLSRYPLMPDRGMIVRGTGKHAIDVDLTGFVPVVPQRVVVNGYNDRFGTQYLFAVNHPEALSVSDSRLDLMDRTRIVTQPEYQGETFIPARTYIYYEGHGWFDQAYREVNPNDVLEPGKAYFLHLPRANKDVQWVWSHTPGYVNSL